MVSRDFDCTWRDIRWGGGLKSCKNAALKNAGPEATQDCGSSIEALVDIAIDAEGKAVGWMYATAAQ
jgi:hypothetical protein